MSKDPAVLFYTSDFIAGTLTMSHEQRGKYILLLCLQHQQGKLSEEDMLAICGIFDVKIYSKFTRNEDGFYYNERMKEESERRKKYSESRSSNRKNISSSYVEHMETETEDINTDIIKNNSNENFDKFWAAYPNKKEKQETQKRWKKLKTLPNIEILLTAIRKQIDWRNNSNGEFRPEWKNPATWLNRGCWEDELKSIGGTNAKPYTSKGNFGVNRGLDAKTSAEADEIEREFAIRRELEAKEASTIIQNCTKPRNDNQRDNDTDGTGNDNETP
jgi:uncharacterized protein YdaU (DUF1376 family)